MTLFSIWRHYLLDCEMHIVAITWLFVVGLMSLAEATSSQGTVLGALITLLLYGLLPMSVVLYIMATPARRRARRRAEQEEAGQASDLVAPDASAESPAAPSTRLADADRGGHAAGEAVAPERKEA
jgi:predicted lipid-binding transport protein (Tim44 family)